MGFLPCRIVSKRDRVGDTMKKDLFTIPNILCYFRIILVPAFLYVFMNAKVKEDYYFAAGIILIGGITDFLDGFIARKFNMITQLGKIIDPIADKLMQLAIIAVLAIKFPLMRVLIMLFIIKEASMLIGNLYAMKTMHRKLDGAKWFGKVSTAVFYIVSVILIADPLMKADIRDLFIIIAIFFMSLSFVLYIPVFYHMSKPQSEE